MRVWEYLDQNSEHPCLGRNLLVLIKKVYILYCQKEKERRKRFSRVNILVNSAKQTGRNKAFLLLKALKTEEEILEFCRIYLPPDVFQKFSKAGSFDLNLSLQKPHCLSLSPYVPYRKVISTMQCLIQL